MCTPPETLSMRSINIHCFGIQITKRPFFRKFIHIDILPICFVLLRITRLLYYVTSTPILYVILYYMITLYTYDLVVLLLLEEALKNNHQTLKWESARGTPAQFFGLDIK